MLSGIARILLSILLLAAQNAPFCHCGCGGERGGRDPDGSTQQDAHGCTSCQHEAEGEAPAPRPLDDCSKAPSKDQGCRCAKGIDPSLASHSGISEHTSILAATAPRAAAAWELTPPVLFPSLRAPAGGRPIAARAPRLVYCTFLI